MENGNQNTEPNLAVVLNKLWKLIAVFIVLVASFVAVYLINEPAHETKNGTAANDKEISAADLFPDPAMTFWKAQNPESIVDSKKKSQVLYGKELIAHTANYLGPNGTIRQITNGMNCQNCHLDAGTKVFGNNYGSVASMYPKFRARSGTVESIYKRVNDCMERSLNGQPLDTLSREMQAIKAYIEFIGSNVPKGEKAMGSGFKDLTYLDRAADPAKGKLAYTQKCQSCHQADGQGLQQPNGREYTYPPLWGTHSFNNGAGLYRITNFAKYVKYNMPLGVTHLNTQLTDEEAWDIAAFVNSQNRPQIKTPNDWPDISKKPVDHPFGPYADSFSEKQHKFGPWKPILQAQKSRDKALKDQIPATAKK